MLKKSLNRKVGKKPDPIGGILLIIFLGFFLYKTGIELVRFIQIIPDPVRIDGRVTSRQFLGGYDGFPWVDIIVEYTDNKGSKHQFEESYICYFPFFEHLVPDIGDQVSVIYKKSTPKTAILSSLWKSLFEPLLGFVLWSSILCIICILSIKTWLYTSSQRSN